MSAAPFFKIFPLLMSPLAMAVAIFPEPTNPTLNGDIFSNFFVAKNFWGRIDNTSFS
jgi:hypothetical protein